MTKFLYVDGIAHIEHRKVNDISKQSVEIKVETEKMDKLSTAITKRPECIHYISALSYSRGQCFQNGNFEKCH